MFDLQSQEELEAKDGYVESEDFRARDGLFKINVKSAINLNFNDKYTIGI